jgi:hypothetical protein
MLSTTEAIWFIPPRVSHVLLPHLASGAPARAARPMHCVLDHMQRGRSDMPKEWTDKRERQYEHIKESYQDRGVSKDEAKERAARTVNKERSEKGETKSGD